MEFGVLLSAGGSGCVEEFGWWGGGWGRGGGYCEGVGFETGVGEEESGRVGGEFGDGEGNEGLREEGSWMLW